MAVNKKIAVLCNYQLLPERVGGMDYFFWLFDAKCKENNIQVDWFFPNAGNHGNYASLTIINCNYEEVEVYFYQNYSNQNYSQIITHFIELCTPFFKKIKRKTVAKIIAVDHNPRPIAGYSLKKKFEKKVKGFLYSKYIDVFVGVSDYTVNEIIKDFGLHVKNKTITIYNGVVIEDIVQRHHRNTENQMFLVASHLRKSKGVQDLIDAVFILPEIIKEKIKIDIFGDGPYKSYLVNKVKQLNLEDNFNFKGSEPNLKHYFCNYDYMIQPTYMECFSLSILESLAANVPVITTNVGGNEEAVKNNENGFIFKPKDINELSDIILKLYKGKIGIKNNTRIEIENQFSLDKMIENHFELLV